MTHDVYSFTRDSKQLVYATDEFGEFNQAWTYDLASRHADAAHQGGLGHLVRRVLRVRPLSHLGRQRRCAHRRAHPRHHQTARKSRCRICRRATWRRVRFSRDETRLALLVSSDTSPNDVYTIDLGAQRSARLTHALNPKIKEADLVETEVVRYPSYDELKIPSILYQPQTASATNKVPVLVWVHGGPGGQSRRGYSATIQHLVNHGYGVLAANNRGSSGYGKTFYHMDDRKHGRRRPQGHRRRQELPRRRSTGSTPSASASSAARTAATWSARRSRSRPTRSTSASTSSA